MPRILLVEDEPTIAESIRFVLEREGFSCTWERTGAAGLSVARAGGIDLVILDVGLPDMSGFDVCRELRASSTTPILFLTARNEEIDRILGLELGADDYVTKPFSPREVLARIKAILRRLQRTAGGGGATAVVGKTPFGIDTQRHGIRFFETLLELSAQEYKILEVLVRSPGRVFTREHLMNLVWENPDMSLERTVDAHIKNIRAKLRIVRDDVDAIVTHRGVGYALREDW